MATVPQSSWFCTLRLVNTGGVSSAKVNPRNCTFKTVKVSSSSSNSESSAPNFSNSPEKSLDAKPGETDLVKVAFAKAQAYKKSIQSNPTPKIARNPVSESSELGNKNDGSASEVTNNGGNEEVPLSVRLAMEKPKEYKQNKEITVGSSGLAGKSEAFSGIKNDGSVSEVKNGGNQEVPVSVKLAMEKAKVYKKDKGSMGSDSSVEGSKTITGLKGGNGTISENMSFGNMAGKKEELTVSSIDFMGLDFGEKKSRGLPAGLLPVADPFPEGNLPEVEILVGDSSRFGNAMGSNPKIEENKSDIYKPKVSTWGVFPRPSNISETYGGGRVIHPGEVLETAEDKAAKEERTRELLAAYRRKTGLSIDPKLKSECEKALKDGDSLMDLGNLKEALPFYEEVMDKLPFQSELHGLAALQWSICQDSLSRPNEARVMYERLQSHPNVKVSKQSKQFLFGFQAMEMMKIRGTTRSPVSTGYQNYFEAFIEDKANFPLKDAEVEEGALSQALPYIIFLVSPIFIVLLIAVQKGI